MKLHITFVIGYLLLSLSITFLTGCLSPNKSKLDSSTSSARFQILDAQKSGLQFSNILDEDNLTNPFNYINAYNGGGVAIGDINNDGLQDIYLTGNMVSSKLFLNMGNLKFKDITLSSGTGTKGWCTGVTMADVNNDGFLDIYVCRNYEDDPEKRTNLCFINNQNGTFDEKSKGLGIDDSNYSICASFLDFDRDGDLDLTVGNTPRYRLEGDFMHHYNLWKHPVPEYSNKLYRNDHGKFIDVTKESGLLSYGFTLGVTTSDLNVDGWPDIWFSVDHDEPDIILYNNKDGTFRNASKTAVKEVSRSSMGIDAGDLNHDLYPDIAVVEMLSEDHFREKVVMSMQTVSRFQTIVDSFQFTYYQMRNFLHLNNGNETFSDVGQLANIHKTDWSWSSLFFDADNDGWQDLYVCNGYWRDIYNKDTYKPFDSTMLALGNQMDLKNQLATKYAKSCVQTKLSNYLFRNQGDLTFENISNSANVDKPTISTGGAYGDLDNDGDLDLVINNIGENCDLIENISPPNNYLRIKFEYQKGMVELGAKVTLKCGSDFQQREQLNTRGYQSSSEPIIHFGLGNVKKVDEVTIVWPNGKQQTMQNVTSNQTILARFQDATDQFQKPDYTTWVTEVPSQLTGLNYEHFENGYDDYIDQVLLPHKMTQQGPHLVTGDINQDGLTDIFFPGAATYPGQLFIQNQKGLFNKKSIPAIEADRIFEDGHAIIFDANGDGYQDICVGSSGYEYIVGPVSPFPNRLYLNDGKGNFQKSKDAFPHWDYPTSAIQASDYDQDGDMDLFIGGYCYPQRYPESTPSSIYENDGKGHFKNITKLICPELQSIGMVKDAKWCDINQDHKMDLVIVGEWMPITIMVQENGKLVNKTEKYFNTPMYGWWNSIATIDLDGNGLLDLVAGNLGLNYKYKASTIRPFKIFSGDIDKNGKWDIVLGTYYGTTMYPVRGRTCSSQQCEKLIKSKFPDFTSFAKADIQKVYGEELKNMNAVKQILLLQQYFIR